MAECASSAAMSMFFELKQNPEAIALKSIVSIEAQDYSETPISYADLAALVAQRRASLARLESTLPDEQRCVLLLNSNLV